MGFLVAGFADFQGAAADGFGLAGSAVDFDVAASDGPVPGGLDDALGFGIGEDDGGFVFYFGVDVGLDLLRDRGDGERTLAVHDPGHEIDAVAAEIVERAAAVESWIGEPV